MFEGILASILNKYLSQYIDEVDYNNLKIGLFSGTLELSDIKIKKSALYQFDLPIEVKCGKIGKLRINISWKSIMTKPAVAEIEDLFVLLGPFEDNINDPKRIEEIVQAYKRKVLQEFEKIDKAEIYENKEKGFAEKVQDTIINNIQVYVRNVHIRYEDKFAIKNKIISCGLYLSEFRAETVDSAGNPNFLNANEKIIFKQGSLNEFNLYWNSSPNVNAGSADTLISVRPEFKTDKNFAWNLLKESIRSGSLLNTTFNTFMEKNLSLSTTLTLRRSLKKEEMHLPKITFQSSVSAIEFIFMRSQYKSILEIIDHYTLLNIHKKYVKYRPRESLKEKPSAWWKYAFTSLAETTWRSYRRERMLSHWKSYKSYLKLYERKVELTRRGKELDAKEKKSLELLEDALLLQSVIDARNLVQEKFKPSDIKVLVVGQSPDKPLKRDFGDRPLDYVEFRLMLYFPLISLRLRNAGHDILKINFRNIATRFELRPIADSVYFLINTRGIDLFGIYYKESISSSSSTNTLVPIVKSLTSSSEDAERQSNLWLTSPDTDAKILVNEEDQDVLFMFCFESNPINIENVESSIRVRFSQAEIFYEKTAITELLRFFKTDLIDFVEVKKIREVWTKAGVIYAVENHKQIHVSAQLASPYFILPMKGTCTEPGNSIVFFLGKTHIESQVQAKLTNYTPSSIGDLNEHFYDKLKLTVNDVQIILVPTGVDWKSYLSDCQSRDYKYHILYPVTTENTVFFSINPSYKKLPKLKLNAVCSSIRLNFSDNKILKIYDFSQKFPLPEVPKVSGPGGSSSSTTTSPSSSTATSARSSMLSPTSPTGPPKRHTSTDYDSNNNNNKIRMPKNASSASIVEPDDEWDGPFMLPVDINGDPIPNYCQLLFNLKVKTFAINLNSTNEHLKEDDPAEETKYLDFALNEIRIDFAITKYGLNFRAGLGDLKLIDKLHDSQGRTETEILSSLTFPPNTGSSSSTHQQHDLIRFYFRKVEENAPNFATLYAKILSNVMFDCSNIQVACHRSVIVYFLNYAKRITDNLSVDRKSASSSEADAVSGSHVIAHVDDKSRESSVSKQIAISADVCEFNVIARMNQLKWDMYDTSLTFGNMTVNNLSINFNIRGLRTELGVQLRTILIHYTDTESVINDAYEQIVQCVGDKSSDQFFDFSLILYGEDKTKKTESLDDKRKRTARIDENENMSVSLLNAQNGGVRPVTLVAAASQQDSIKLRVGRIKIICLVKFFNELVNFMEPIVNPLPSNLTEQVKDQAIEAVKSAYQDVEQTEKIILLDIQVTSPQVVIPQNSGSLSGFLVDLGHLKITNSIRNVPLTDDNDQSSSSLLRRNVKFSVIDDISLSLQSVEVKRILYEKTGADFYKIKEQVVDPVNLTARIQRTVKNLDKQSIPDIEISAVIVNLDSRISLKTARLLFAILNENLNEGLQQQSSIDEEEEKKNSRPTTTNNTTSKTNKLPNILEEEENAAVAAAAEMVKSKRVNMKINLELKKIRVSVVESPRSATSTTTDPAANISSSGANNSINVTNNSSTTASPQKNQTSLDLTTTSSNNTTSNFLSKFVNFSLLQIEDIQVDFSSREDKSWLANLKLRALSVFDTRPDSNLAVKEMIIPIDHDKYFIEMVYSSDPGVLDHLTFVLDHIRINLCLPYILKLYSMATDAVSSPPTTGTTKSNESAAGKTNKKAITGEETTTTTAIEETTTARTKMSVVGKVRLPDVVLFAQPEKQDSKILNVSADIHLAFHSDQGATSLEINLVEMSIRLGEFNNSKRQGIPFLAPCSALVTMNQSNAKEIARYYAVIDSLYFNMTPTLYEVVMGVIGTLNNAGTESQAKQKEIKKRLEESDPFVLYDVDPDIQHAVATGGIIDDHHDTATNRTINELTVDHETRAATTTPVVKETHKSKTKLLEILELTIKEAYITFCEESGVDLQPLAIVRLELNGRVSNWTRNLHTKASLCLEASYYNDNLSNWEPLIENVMQKEDLYRPWILRLWFAIDPGHALRPPDDNIGIQDTEFSVADLDYSPIDGDDETAENENRKNDAGGAQPRLFGRSVPTLKLASRRKKSVKPTSGGGEDTDDEEDEDDEHPSGNEYSHEAMDEKYKASHILVESNDLLNINLTPSAYKVLMYLTSITGGSDANKEFVESKAKPLLKFMNFIGEKGELVLSSELFLKPEHAIGFDLKFVDPSSVDILPTSSSTSLFGGRTRFESDELDADEIMQDRVHDIALNSQRSQIDNAYNEAYKFELVLNGFQPVRLSMKTDGSFLFQLRTRPRELQSASLEPLLLNHNDDDDDHDENEKQIAETSFYSSTFKYNAMFKVRTLYGRTKVIFSSPLQIENYSPLRLLIMVELTDQNKAKLNILERVETENKSYAVIFYLVPGKVFYVPLYVAYNCKLYTAPQQLKHTPGVIFDVRGYNLRLDDINEINFTSSANNNSKLAEFQLIRTLNLNVRSHRNVMPSMHANYVVSLYSPMRILNCLPFPIRLDMTDTDDVKLALEPGEVLNTHLRRGTTTLCKLNVINYLNVSWAGHIDWNELTRDDAPAEVIKLELDVPPTNELTIKGKHLTIYISYKKPNEFMFFSPYWLVNKSGQHIQIRACDTLRHFEVPDDSILLFDYKTINKDNKVRMCVNTGMWSEPFSLETVGTTGMIQCKDERRTYNFLMRITMSNSSRAKLITFAPFLSIVNELDQSMLIREWQYHERFVDKKEWKSIEPIVQTNRPTSYWPNNAGESKQVCFVLRTTDGFETQPFPLENPGRFVLPLKQNRPATTQKSDSKSSNLNDPSGTSNPLLNGASPPPALRIVTVLISGGSQNPVTIIIRKYVYGDAVAKLVNLCPYNNITIKPKYVDSGWTLEPMKSMFFVWPELIKSTRELTWSVNSSSSTRHVESLNLANSGKTECVFKSVEIKLPPQQHPTTSNSFNNSDDTNSHNLNDTNNLLSSPPRNNSNMNGSHTGLVSSIRRDLTIYCVSYIDGSQRVIVFTTDSSLAEIERKKEASNMEIFVALKGILISVVNNSNLEIACISLKDSRPLWSLSNPVTNGNKMFTNEYSEWLEKVYNLYLLNSNRTFRKYIKRSVHIPGAEGIGDQDDQEAAEGTSGGGVRGGGASKHQRRMAGNKFDIDFKHMRMYKPEKGHLKRIWQPGLSVQYLVSSNMMSLKCCIFNLQIDNQLPDAYFPISFHKAPKRMDDEKPFVPFLTLSLFTEQQEVLQIYRCFDCLFQEFFLKLDKGFLFSMKSWYDSAAEETSIDDRAFDLSGENSKEAINIYFNLEPDKETLQRMSNDLKLAKEIMEYANQSGGVKQSAHIRFDDFYISPIQFNLSFSVNGTPHTDGKDLQLGGAEMVFNFFLESIGATVTEFKDVRFRFNQFDLNNVTKTWKEIYDEIFDHYKIQTLHQAYALILGLDVLGNPYGLVTDFSQGLTDLFFDPLLGIFSKSKKKRDFKMRKRIKATVNKTISSAAGSGSLISGSVGRVLAAISLDKEYKQKRQYKLSKLPYKSIPETLLIASKGVVAGTVYGVAGVVKKPIEEKKNGSGGVAAGVGKGLLGLFAKPVGSVFDGISISLDGLKRFAQAGLETVINTRLPRHLIHEVAILPYSEYQAQGYEILRDLQNDNMALNENYWAHMFYGFKKNATLIFITDCNIYRLKKTRTQIFAKWYIHDPPVSLHKIKQVKVMNLTPEEKNSGLFSTIIQGKVPDEAQKIYVTFVDQPNIEQLKEDQKIMLLTSTPEVIGWLKDKISSVIKYYKELKRAGELL